MGVRLLAAPVSPLSDLSFFSRCYAQLTQKKLPLRHPLRLRVVQGSLSPVDACLAVLDGASLSVGAEEGKLIEVNPESKAVLRAMNDLHRNWFPSDDVVFSSPQCGERCPYADFLHDGSEAALHVTRALLTENARFSEVVTGESGMEALRSRGPIENNTQALNRVFLGNSVTTVPDDSPVPLDVELVQFGDLLGVRKISLNPRKGLAVTKSNTAGSRPNEFPIHGSLGGGILGTKSYMLLNMGRPDANSMNGGLVLPRRWAKSLLKDLLCRDVPVIRSSDAISFVETAGTKDTPPFRTSASCMQCHGTMDPLSGVARNVVYTYTPGYAESSIGSSKQISPQIYAFPTNLPPENGTVDLDPDFYRRPTSGRLYFRNLQGELVNIPIQGIASLGQRLAESDDFYACAASRYFQFFTGIQVNMDDPGADGHAVMSKTEKKYRDMVIHWGSELKAHQSLHRLFRTIMESDTYRSSSYTDTELAGG